MKELEGAAAMENLRDGDYDVALTKSGDKEAFGRLIHRYKMIMYRVARGILHSPEDIDDAIGDSILKAYINIDSLKNDNYFKPWLLKILVNECYTILKKRKREISTEDNQLELGSYEDNYSDFELAKAINLLEENQKVVTILFYYEDMSLKDIAKVLELPEGTVKSRLSRAKKNLEKLIGNGREE